MRSRRAGSGGSVSATGAVAWLSPSPAGTYDKRAPNSLSDSVRLPQCRGRCDNAAFLWKSGQRICVYSSGAIALFVCMPLLSALVPGIVVCVWRRRRSKAAASAVAQAKVEAKAKKEQAHQDFLRAAAVKLCEAMVTVRDKLAASAGVAGRTHWC